MANQRTKFAGLDGGKAMKVFIGMVLLWASAANADWHVQLHGLSWHSNSTYEVAAEDGTRTQAKYNALNLGIGLRYAHSDALSVQAGVYRSSHWTRDPNRIDRSPVEYVVADWTPLQALGADVGASAGLTRGYGRPDRIKPVASLVARWQGERLNVTLRGGAAPKSAARAFAAVEAGIRF